MIHVAQTQISLQDVDHRVREATQQGMEQLVLRVGRNLAPHLRYVIGPWLCAQYDTYALVASSGKKSFQAAFSEEKQAGVIKFCRKELFEVCLCSRNNRIYRGSIFLGPEWSCARLEQCWLKRDFVLSIQTFMIGKDLLIRNFTQAYTLRKYWTGNSLPAAFNF